MSRTISIAMILGLVVPSVLSAGTPPADSRLDELAFRVVRALEDRIGGVEGTVTQEGPPDVVARLDLGLEQVRTGTVLALFRSGEPRRIGVLRCLERHGAEARCRVVHLRRGFRPEPGDRITAPPRPITVAVPPVDDRRLDRGGAGPRLRELVLDDLEDSILLVPVRGDALDEEGLRMELILYRQQGRLTAMALLEDRSGRAAGEMVVAVPDEMGTGPMGAPPPGEDLLAPGRARARAEVERLLDLRLLEVGPELLTVATLETGRVRVLVWQPPDPPETIQLVELPRDQRVRHDRGALWWDRSTPDSPRLMATTASAGATLALEWSAGQLEVTERLPGVRFGRTEVAGREVQFGAEKIDRRLGFEDGWLWFPGGRQVHLEGFPAGWSGAVTRGGFIYAALPQGGLVPYDVGSGTADRPMPDGAGWIRLLDLDGDGLEEMATGSRERCDREDRIRLLDPADLTAGPLRVSEPFPAGLTGLDAWFTPGEDAGWVLCASTPCSPMDAPSSLWLFRVPRRPR